LARMAWDQVGDRLYERGVDRGVLYVDGSSGVPWNGLTSISEKPSGGDLTPYYIDGQRFYQNSANEEFLATLTAYTYPDEFESCEGITEYNVGMFLTGQDRLPFGLCYRTKVGNDVSLDLGYKLHILYNAMVPPTDRTNDTESESVNPLLFSWDVQVVPIQIPGFKPTAHIVLDSRVINGSALSAIEDILYGNSMNDARLPLISELSSVIDAQAALIVIDNGDGTATIIGDAVTEIDANTYNINWPSVTEIDEDTYNVASL
jgi:hypothetical protein